MSDTENYPLLDLRGLAKKFIIDRLLENTVREHPLLLDPSIEQLLLSHEDSMPESPPRSNETIGASDGRISKVEKDLSSLKEEFKRFSTEVEQLSRVLQSKQNKEDALAYYSKRISEVPEITAVYAFETQSGFDIWTIHSARSNIKVMDKVSEAQVELDRMFKGLYFDFNLLKSNEVDPNRLEGARLVYNRGGV